MSNQKDKSSFTINDYVLNGLYFFLNWPFKYLPSPIGDIFRYIFLFPFLRSKHYFRIYEGVTIWYPYRICIGKKVTLNEWVYLSGYGGLKISDGCSIGHRVSIITSNHGLKREQKIKDQPLSSEPVFLGKDVWVGANATILGGVKIGDGAVIAAGAVVTTDVEEYSVYGGVPAKKISSRE